MMLVQISHQMEKKNCRVLLKDENVSTMCSIPRGQTIKNAFLAEINIKEVPNLSKVYPIKMAQNAENGP